MNAPPQVVMISAADFDSPRQSLIRRATVRYNNRTVSADESTEIRLYLATGSSKVGMIIAIRPTSIHSGDPGGCPICNPNADAANSPQSQNGIEGCMVERYTK